MMKYQKLSVKTFSINIFFIYVVGLLLLILYPAVANSGPYLNSAHGNSSYGVNRTSISTFGYSTGNCAHCHEQHAMIGGSEPTPTGGPDNYALFYTNHVDQTDNFCFKCHTDLSSLQTGSLINRSYSYRAGGYTSDTLNDILEAFSFTSPGSSHNLDDILTFINGKWEYTADSNPCAACHNPHRAQGDPANSPNSAKTSGTRGWPVSRPSQHSKDNNVWELWGDDSGEKMSDYTSNYQAPYRYNSTTTYEPDGSTTQDGSNLTDYATFCTDCHNATNTIYSHELGWNLYKIDWETGNGDKHGKRVADTDACLKPPYGDGTNHCDAPPDRVLSCLDCHEPHGSSNVVLIRKEVNKGEVDVPDYQPPDNNRKWRTLCQKCHDDYNNNPQWLYAVHHQHPDSDDEPYPYSEVEGHCGDCHDYDDGDYYFYCTRCHFHGGDDSYLYQIGAGQYATGRRTF